MSYRLFPRSLRWRLQLWLAFLLVCVLTGFGLTVDQLIRVNRHQQIDKEVEVRVAALGRALRDAPFVRRTPGRPPPNSGPGRPEPRRPDGPPPGGQPGEEPPPMRPPDDIGPEPLPDARPAGLALSADITSLFGPGTGGYYYVVWYRDGSVLTESPGAPEGVDQPEVSEHDTLVHWRTRQQFREAFHCSGFGDCALAGRSIEADADAMGSLTLGLLAAGIAILAIGVGAGWCLTTRAIRPIEQISAAAMRISRGNLSERVPVADNDNELARLAGVLNSTFARLETAFIQQRQFTADAAHELRTPLAVIITETQATLARERQAAEYRDAMEVCLGAAQQMRRLTESLLELERLDAARDQAVRIPVDLVEAARIAMDLVLPLADERGIRIHVDFRPAHALTTPDRLGHVITNLLTNAIHYNKSAGEVSIATFSEPGASVLSVADTGVGISSADLPRIFDRFYRVDKARSRADGHTGLGLAISKAIVEAEGGTIEVVSSVGTGTTFWVRLPSA